VVEVAQRQLDAAAFGDSSSWEERKGTWVVRKGGRGKGAHLQSSSPSTGIKAVS